MKKYLIELSVIVVGVTIALVFENLNNTLTENSKLEKTLVTISDELKSHEETLVENISKQDELLFRCNSETTNSISLNFSKLVLPRSAHNVMLYNNSIEIMDQETSQSILDYYCKIDALLVIEQMTLNTFSDYILTHEKGPYLFWIKQLNEIEKELLLVNQDLQASLIKSEL